MHIDTHNLTVSAPAGQTFGVTHSGAKAKVTIAIKGAVVWSRSFARSTRVTHISDTVEWQADDDVVVSINGCEFAFRVPRPPQPYPSWVWDGGWKAPVPHPDEGAWLWDEEAGDWLPAPELESPDEWGDM